MGRDTARLTATVRGRVQGVYYRGFVADQARARALTGYARNLADGQTVEVVAEGAREDLERLIPLLRQGPPLALVTDVALSWADALDEYSNFTIRHKTA